MTHWNSTKVQWARNKAHARENRTLMSQPEKIIWEMVSGKQMNGLKFRRQHSLGPYIADYYCHNLRLILEIDGWSHDDIVGYDQVREQYFLDNGFRTYHIQVDRVLHNTDDVRFEIEQLVLELMDECK